MSQTFLYFALTFILLSFFISSSYSAKEDLFVESAQISGNRLTLPLYRGQSKGRNVYFVVLDASDSSFDFLKVNRAQKLQKAKNTNAVQRVSVNRDGLIEFPGSVDFTPERIVIPTPGTGFPPKQGTQPGSVGEQEYSPLIQFPNGTILNAPIIASDYGRADKVLDINFQSKTVTLLLSEGYARGKRVKYVSLDSSDPVAAALEGVTYAPKLNSAPKVGDDSSKSSRASLAAFINGQTGSQNEERQGLNSAILDGLDPLNVLAWNPKQGRYSPLWDVFLAKWNDEFVSQGYNVLQTDFSKVEDLGRNGTVTSPSGGPFSASNFIVNCPIIAQLN